MSKIDLYKGDCLEVMDELIAKGTTVDTSITDIPYDNVNRKSNGLRKLDKGKADILTFNLQEFLEKNLKITNNIIIVFCGKEQFSEIYEFFANKKGTVRPIIWQKSNPSPMNGQHIYLSGVEMAVWFKKSGTKTFNAHCKNTVFKFPNGRSKLHPTEKNHDLIRELISDNSSIGQTIGDFTMGSGTHIMIAKEMERNGIGIELDDKYFDIAKNRIENTVVEKGLFDE